MDAYHDRLNQEAPELLQTKLPEISEIFGDLLNQEDFQMSAMATVRHYITTACSNLRQKKSELRVLKNKELSKSNEPQRSFTVGDDESMSVSSTGSKKRKLMKITRQNTDSSTSSSRDTEDEESDEEAGGGHATQRAQHEITIAVAQLRCNPHISRMIDSVKPHLRDVMESCNTIRSWLKMLMPEMQDGNNFGVEVQNEILEYVKRLEMDSGTTIQAMSIYHLTRAEVIAAFAKYPGVMDFSRGLEELDLKEFLTLRVAAMEMRNSCFALVDMFQKNIEKVKKPRSHSAGGNMLCS